MNKTYVSTRNHQDQINFYQAIVQGIGDDGGLLVPNFDFQKLDLNKLVQLNYVDLATDPSSMFKCIWKRFISRNCCSCKKSRRCLCS